MLTGLSGLTGLSSIAGQSDGEDPEVPFDPSQLSTPPTLWLEVLANKVFSDTAGTTPANATEAVKRLNPSGAATIYADDDAGAITELATYYVDASGRHWLNCIDFCSLKLSTPFAITGAFTCWARMARDLQGGTDCVAAGGDGNEFTNAILPRFQGNESSNEVAFQTDNGTILTTSGNGGPLYRPAVVRVRSNGTTTHKVSIDNGDEYTPNAEDITSLDITLSHLLIGSPVGVRFNALIIAPANITSTTEWNNMDAYLRRIP